MGCPRRGVLDGHRGHFAEAAGRRCLEIMGTGLLESCAPLNMGGGYVNFMFDDEADGRLQAAYGDNYARLAAAKMKYDPKNLFRVNQNIAPAAAV